MSSSDNTDTYIVILTNEIYIQLPVDLVTTEPQGTEGTQTTVVTVTTTVTVVKKLSGIVPLLKNPACRRH